MSKITMKYVFRGRGHFLTIQVEESDIQTQHQIKIIHMRENMPIKTYRIKVSNNNYENPENKMKT